MIRVLIADDHPIVVDGVRRFLACLEDIEVVGQASSRASLEREVASTRPDVVVLDLHMPGMAGLQTIRELTAAPGAPAYLIFSMQAEDAYALSLIRAGAAGFLNKGRAPDEVAAAVRAVHRGGRYLSDDLAARMWAAPGEKVRPPHEALSGREREVFDLLVQGKKAPEVAAALGISASTVHTYLERIRVKLDVEHTSEILSYAFRQGLAR